MMNRKSKAIVIGKIHLENNKYVAEIFGDVLIVKNKFFSKELIDSISRRIIKFESEEKGAPILYLYIDKYFENYYSGTSFKIQLLYRHYEDVVSTYFMIESKGFTNSINKSFNNGNNIMAFIKSNLNKKFLKCTINLDGDLFECYFENIVNFKRNNLCPAEFTSCLIMHPMDNIYFNKIKKIYDFASSLLQFITINTYPKIDSISIYNTIGGCSDIEIYDDNVEIDTSNDHYISLAPFDSDISNFLECFPNGIVRQYNLFHYKREWVFEFDIVRLSGAFEDVFRTYVEKSINYKNQLEKRKEEIEYKELSKILKKFCKDHNLGGNEDFDACRSLFDNYGGTLKNKLEYALIDFCNTMDYIIIDNNFFYSPSLFETRLKDARNAICHGLHNKDIDWRNAANDTFILQELIYFIILKYKMKLELSHIKECIDLSFGILNRNTSFYKKDDPRIKWVDENIDNNKASQQ